MEISVNSKDFTPKKPAKRGPKPKEGSANDICRLCFSNLKQKFGDFEKSMRISTANLFKPSTQAGCQNNDTLADLCSRIGLDVVKSSTLSERVCQSCARKIRNAVQLYEFIASSLDKNTGESGESQSTISNIPSGEESPTRFKRLLPTSISSSQRSPQPKKGHRRNAGVKKTLNFASTDENEKTSNVEIRDQRCDLLNVDDLLEKQTSQLKVVIVAPNGRVESHSSFDDKTKSTIVNLCRKNWKTAANSFFQQPNCEKN